MARWKRTLHVGRQFQAAKRGEISPQQLAAQIASLLSKLSPLNIPFIDDARADLVTELEDLSNDASASSDDFDEVMGSVYDWADTPLDDKWNGWKVCWVDVFDSTPMPV